MDWTGLGRIGLDWTGLMRGARCKMQDAGSAEKDQAGMKGAGACLMGCLNERLRGREVERASARWMN